MKVKLPPRERGGIWGVACKRNTRRARVPRVKVKLPPRKRGGICVRLQCRTVHVGLNGASLMWYIACPANSRTYRTVDRHRDSGDWRPGQRRCARFVRDGKLGNGPRAERLLPRPEGRRHSSLRLDVPSPRRRQHRRKRHVDQQLQRHQDRSRSECSSPHPQCLGVCAAPRNLA